MRKCAVGGQAVMEGVMMKSDKGIAMAVRRADGKIVASYKNQVSKAQKGTFWGLPIIRGVVALVESLTTGMSTTMKTGALEHAALRIADRADHFGAARFQCANKHKPSSFLCLYGFRPLRADYPCARLRP